MGEAGDKGLHGEKAEEVLQAFLIFDPEELMAPLRDFAPQSELPRAFIKNAVDGLRSVSSAGTLPYQLVSHSVQQRHFDRFHAAERIRTLKKVEASKEPSEEVRLQQAFQIASERMIDFAGSEEGLRQIRDGIVYDLHWHLSSPVVAEAAFELLVQTLVSAWALFESSIRTFIISWINANPHRATSILGSENLKSYFGKQVVDIAVIGHHGFDLTGSMGDVLFRDRRLDHLAVIRAVLEALFLDPGIREALGDDMWMLNQRRHLFVHKRGLVDEEYVRRTGEHVDIGQRLSVTSHDVEHYIRAVQTALVTIAKAADRDSRADEAAATSSL